MNQSEEGIGVKDFLVAVPLTASVLALSWEIGSFIPTGGFSFFSIAEHIVAAAPALPAALLFSIIVPFTAVVSRWGAPVRTAITYRNRLVGFLLAMALNTLLIWLMTRFFEAVQQAELSFLIVFAICSFTAADAIVFNFSTRTRAAAYACGAVLFTIAFAAESTLRAMKRAEEGKELTVISTKDAVLHGSIQMVGQQGVLLYLPSTKQMHFEKADNIRNVQWSPDTSILPLRLR